MTHISSAIAKSVRAHVIVRRSAIRVKGENSSAYSPTEKARTRETNVKYKGRRSLSVVMDEEEGEDEDDDEGEDMEGSDDEV